MTLSEIAMKKFYTNLTLARHVLCSSFALDLAARDDRQKILMPKYLRGASFASLLVLCIELTIPIH